MAVNKAPWRTSEKRIVIDLYPTGGLKAVMEKLPHRSASAIREAARRYGVKAGWSPSETRIIMDLYPTGGSKAVMKMLRHRSESAVRHAARRFGVKRIPRSAQR